MRLMASRTDLVPAMASPWTAAIRASVGPSFLPRTPWMCIARFSPDERRAIGTLQWPRSPGARARSSGLVTIGASAPQSSSVGGNSRLLTMSPCLWKRSAEVAVGDVLAVGLGVHRLAGGTHQHLLDGDR